jgi:hypothetical protein
VVTGSKESNIDNLNSVRHEASRHCTKKKREYLKAKFNELVKNSKLKNIRDCVGAAMTIRRVASLELTW